MNILTVIDKDIKGISSVKVVCLYFTFGSDTRSKEISKRVNVLLRNKGNSSKRTVSDDVTSIRWDSHGNVRVFCVFTNGGAKTVRNLSHNACGLSVVYVVVSCGMIINRMSSKINIFHVKNYIEIGTIYTQFMM